MNLPPETIAEIVRLYVDEQLSQRDVGLRVRVHANRVAVVIKKAGVTRSRTYITPARKRASLQPNREPVIGKLPSESLEEYCAAIYRACPWGFNLKAARGLIEAKEAGRACS